MDGTLLNDRHEVPADVKSTLAEAKKQGIKIVLCSGRPIVGMRKYIEELNLMEVDDYAIAFNGAFTQNTNTDEIAAQFLLTHQDLTELYNLSKEFNTPMHFYDMENVYTPNADISKYTVLESYLNTLPLRYRQVEEIPTDFVLPKVEFIDDPVKLEQTIQALPKSLYEKYSVNQSAAFFLGIIHRDASKGNAVKQLSAQLGIKQEEVMTIGDNENDISMIEFAGCGVAMGNAIPALKAVANYETLTNNESGVAHAIKELALKPSKV